MDQTIVTSRAARRLYVYFIALVALALLTDTIMAQKTLAAPRHLEANESAEFVIRARLLWNETHLKVMPGEAYVIEPVNPSERWTDFYVRSGPQGYKSWVNAWQAKNLRNLDAPFFALMVTATGESDSVVVVTKDRSRLEYAVVQPGELRFFANDVRHWYWNNWGHITVRITRSK